MSGVPVAPAAPGPALGALAVPAEGASGVTAGIIDADPMPELMQPSGGIR